MKLYLDIHPKDLEPHFSRNMEAMTVENLRDKGDIAVQLAWRDKRITELEAENAKLLEEVAPWRTLTPLTINLIKMAYHITPSEMKSTR